MWLPNTRSQTLLKSFTSVCANLLNIKHLKWIHKKTSTNLTPINHIIKIKWTNFVISVILKNCFLNNQHWSPTKIFIIEGYKNIVTLQHRVCSAKQETRQEKLKVFYLYFLTFWKSCPHKRLLWTYQPPLQTEAKRVQPLKCLTVLRPLLLPLLPWSQVYNIASHIRLMLFWALELQLRQLLSGNQVSCWCLNIVLLLSSIVVSTTLIWMISLLWINVSNLG